MAETVHPVGPMRAAVVFALLTSFLASSVASLSSCKKKEEATASKAPPPPPVQVALAVAEEVAAPRILTLTGIISADQRSEVTADTQGKVVAVLIERGQRVKMGQAVVQLDVRTAALSAREAQANLESARAQKQLAEEECKRAQTLLDKGAITRSEYDRQVTQCTSTLQQVSAAQARADMITKSISDGLVRAPFDGQVTEKSVTPGEWVAPGRTLFTLVDDDPLRIELSVPESEVRKIQKGQKVQVTVVAQPDKIYTATVSRIGGEVGKSRALIVEATLASQGELVPGMFAEANIVIDETQLLAIPAHAVVKHGKSSHTFVAVSGELQKRIIQTGPPLADGRLPVLTGLAKGDEVVAEVTKEIVDGLRVVDAKPDGKPDGKPDAKSDAKSDGKPDGKPEAKPEAK